MPDVPAGSSEDERFLALAALLLAGDAPRPAPAEDELATLRRRHFDEHSLAKSRHPSARAQRSA